jgi:hypothetical protein
MGGPIIEISSGSMIGSDPEVAASPAINSSSITNVGFTLRHMLNQLKTAVRVGEVVSAAADTVCLAFFDFGDIFVTNTLDQVQHFGVFVRGASLIVER